VTRAAERCEVAPAAFLACSRVSQRQNGQVLAPLVRVAFEVAEEAAYLQCLLVGAVVVLAQEVEIRLRPPHGAEGYQVESLEGAAGEGGPVKSVLDG